MIVFATSSVQGSRFTKTFSGPLNFETENDSEFAKERTRVKRQSQSRPCPLPSLNCFNNPFVNTFRTIDGTCNNLKFPYCGASNIPFLRWLPRSPSGEAFRCPLTSCARPRDITVAMNKCPQHHSDSITLMVMQWGQFIDHDLVVTTEEPDERCCQDFQSLTPTSRQCVPIDVRNDEFYSNVGTTVNCLPFVRSRAAPCVGGSDRQTINELTSYVDASMIYGSIDSVASSLRSFSGGRLKTGPGSETLTCPGSTPDICPRSFLPVRTGNNGNPEFFAGDVRVEEQPSLTSIHTLFIRLHNDIADNLIRCSGDELKYQIARKIVGAIVQQITYDEFLPIVLGQAVMDDGSSYGSPLNLNKSYSYNNNICNTAPNGFATAAYRFGHSLLQDEFILSNGNIIKLAESFNNNGVTRNANAFPSHFLSGITRQNARPMDQHIVDAVHNKLFARGPSFAFGSDLYARNIQRGRDHGLPGYVEWFNKCVDYDPARVIVSFDNLKDRMPDCVIAAFRTLYKTVKDIDLFPAGIAEYEVTGGLVGPTFACIIAEFFSHARHGDRFWFQNREVFTPEQIASIRETSLASLICLYTNVDQIQRKVMLPISGSNPLESCATILKEGVLNDITTGIWTNICS